MKKYLITSREFGLHEQLAKHLPDYALYRDKANPNYSIQASHFVEVCKQFEEIKSFIHRDANLAKELGASGVHLTSTQADEIELAKELGLEVIISTHSVDEALKAQDLGADAVTFSPIFASPNKGEPIGVEALEKLLGICEIKVFALGGIVSNEHIELIKKTKAYGFASIRYFY